MSKNLTKCIKHCLIWGILSIISFLSLSCCTKKSVSKLIEEGARLNQKNISQLVEEGARLNEDEIKQLQLILENNADDIVARTELLAYYYQKKIESGVEEKEYQNNLMWIIKNHPDADVLGDVISRISSKDSLFYFKIRELWLEQIENNKNNTKVLGNAAEFFLNAWRTNRINILKRIIIISPPNYNNPYLHPDFKLGEDLLIKTQSLDPNNPEWSEKLAKHYEQTKKYKTGEDKLKIAEKVLEQFENSLDNTSDELKRLDLLKCTANAAMEAGNLAKAKSYAEELLQLAPKHKDSKEYGNSIYQGNLVLGNIAFEENDLEKAGTYLIEAGKAPGGAMLDLSGPDTTLARKLLLAGEREAVIQYLELCKNSWKRGTDRLNEWVDTIKEGNIPVLNKKLKGINTAIFATGLDERNQPIDNIEKISINEKKVYIFTYWNSISNEEHEYKCKIFDGAEQNVFTNQFKFTPTRGIYHTWTWRNIQKNTDTPGNWKFEIYLDDKKVIEKSLVVLAQDEKPFDPSKITNLLKQHEILNQSLAKYKSLKGYQDSTIVEMFMKMQQMENKITIPSLFAFERPNRLRFETNFVPRANMTVISDGITLVKYMEQWNQYIKENAPETLSQMESDSTKEFVYFLNIILSSAPERELLEHVKELVELGQEEIDGIPVTVFELTQPMKSVSSRQLPLKIDLDKPIKIKFWIGNQDYLVRKITLLFNLKELAKEKPKDQRSFSEAEMKLTEYHKSIQVNPIFSKDFFVFVPPESAKLVERFGLSKKREKDITTLVGKPAPEFVLNDVDSNTVSLSDFKGKVLIVDFWATWCRPCIQQMPAYVSLQSQYESQGFTMIGISVDRTAVVVRKFAKEHRLNFPLLMADEKVKREYGGIPVIPTTFVIDKNGIVRYVYKGSPSDKFVFQKHMEELLDEQITEK